jgi:hypothetical protein
VENYLRDRGVKPGMGLADVYSTINAGRPGLYNRSDAANGGAPGTVADKVAGMAPHIARAEMLLSGKLPSSMRGQSTAPSPTPAVASAQAAPMGLAPADSDNGMSALIEAAQRIAAETQDREPLPSALPPMRLGEFPMLAALRTRMTT